MKVVGTLRVVCEVSIQYLSNGYNMSSGSRCSAEPQHMAALASEPHLGSKKREGFENKVTNHIRVAPVPDGWSGRRLSLLSMQH